MFRNLINILPTYSLLFGLYPILSLLGTNRFELEGVSLVLVLRPLLLSGLFVFILHWIFWSITGNSSTGEFSTFIFLLIFYSYGHVENLLSLREIPSNFLLPLWLLLLVIGLFLVVRNKQKIPALKKALLIATAVLICFPIYEIAENAIKSQNNVEVLVSSLPRMKNVSKDLNSKNLDQPEEIQPSDYSAPFDVYYIILDGYGRSDILADIYQYDNQPFIDQLNSRGFYVAENSFANYNQTRLSIPSSLNMEYLQNMGIPNSKTFDLETHLNLLSNSNVFNVFSKNGYFLVNFRSGYNIIDIKSLDYFMQIDGDTGIHNTNIQTINVFGQTILLRNIETLFLKTTILKPILKDEVIYTNEPAIYQDHRNRILFTFNHLIDFSSQDGNYFIYAHILAPHPPFVFNKDGTNRNNYFPFEISDGSHYITSLGSREDYISKYKAQLAYVNELVLKTVDEILKKSENPPVIILQGDHGPGAYLDWEFIDNTYLPERFGIFNAYYFPDQNYENLYSSISPVNSFRVVISQYFSLELDYYDDMSFYSTFNNPYGFEDITNQLH